MNTGKFSVLFGTLLINASLTAFGQLTAPSTGAGNSAQIPPPTPYSVISRGPSSSVHECYTYEQASNGKIIAKKHQYTELGTGLNYWNNGQWTPSKEEIDILPDGTAAATNGQHQVYFPADIYQGAIQMVTPDGKKLQSRPLGLFYDDGTNTVMIAALTNSVGELISANQAVYPNAFAGLNADLQYTYTKGGFEQDVVLHESPFTPESYGLNPDTARLELLTEFFNPPQPTITASLLPAQAGLALTDDNLDFGVMKMVPGRAFLLGANANESQVMVAKQWVTLNGRQFLIEEVPVDALADQLAMLPAPQTASASAKSQRLIASHQLQLPAQRLIKAGIKQQLVRLSKISRPQIGLVLDYQTLLGNTTNVTFQADSTYYISGNTTLYGTNTFEGGAVIKFPSNSVAQLSIATTSAPPVFKWQTTSYRPIIFTAADDNSIGESISGSTGVPSGYYAGTALNFNAPNGSQGPLSLSNFRIAYAQNGIQAGFVISTIKLYDGQFNDCQYVIGGPQLVKTVSLRNILCANIQTNFINNNVQTNDWQNVTFVNVTNIEGGAGGVNRSIVITNCLFINVNSFTNSGVQFKINADFNGFYNSPAFGSDEFASASYPFQTVGAGSYYLSSGSSFHGVGTANIDSTLLSELPQKTTYPPIVYSNTVISTATIFNPQAPRDTNSSPDLGYHYDPLDYVFGGVNLSSNLTFTVGTAVGWFELPGSPGGGYGIGLSNDLSVTFNGTATQPCIFARYDTVQEGNGLWTDKGWLGGIQNGGSYDPYNPGQLNGDFTHIFKLAGDPNNFRDGGSGQPLQIRMNNSEIVGGSGGYNLLPAFTNCLFYRGGIGQSTGDSQYSGETYREIYRNCTFYGGYIDLTHEESPPYWQVSIRDCSFDGTTLDFVPPGSGLWAWLDADYNATNNVDFVQEADLTALPGPNNVYPTGGFNWQNSWFGNFYLPTNSPLINAGDRTADQIGLYHFTTQTNQMVEGFSTVDIGYHYVATDANGNPLDTNGDGLPDYLSDVNGNGLDDPGEVPWNTGQLTLKVLITTPQNDTILP